MDELDKLVVYVLRSHIINILVREYYIYYQSICILSRVIIYEGSVKHILLARVVLE